MNTYITIDQNFLVKEVVHANIAVGFYLAPRSDIQQGDTLTEDEKVMMGLVAAPEVVTEDQPSEQPTQPT